MSFLRTNDQRLLSGATNIAQFQERNKQAVEKIISDVWHWTMYVKRVVAFISNYAEKNGLVAPDRNSSHVRDDFKLLPSSTTKVDIYRLYEAATKVDNNRAVGIFYLALYLASIVAAHCTFETHD